MPANIKIVFSAVVLIVAALSAWFLNSLGHQTTPWLAVFLGVFSVVSFWIFPEVTRAKG